MFIALFLLLLTPVRAQDLGEVVSIRSIQIVSGITESIPSDENKIVEYIDEVTLYAIIEIEKNDGSVIFLSDADSFFIEERKAVAVPIQNSLKNYNLIWYKIENDAKNKWYSNTDPTWHWDELDYKETLIDGISTRITADVATTIISATGLDGKAVGTMRYRVKLIYKGRTFSSPGKNETYKGCISEAVHRISRKGNSGNEIVDYGLAMCNSPYIWGSASYTGSKFDNQAERFVGADCADFAVAAARMAGYKKLPYGGSRTLGPYVTNIARPSRSENGLYYAGNKKVSVSTDAVRPGDFVVWPGHVGLFYKDTDPIGVLDETDLVLHTLFDEPKIVGIDEAYPKSFIICRPKESLKY